MQEKSTFISRLAAISIFVFFSFSLFPRRSTAMQQPPAPEVSQVIDREKREGLFTRFVNQKAVKPILIPVATADKPTTPQQGEAGSNQRPIAPPSGQQLVGTTGALTSNFPSQQSTASASLGSTGSANRAQPQRVPLQIPREISASSLTRKSSSLSGSGGAGPSNSRMDSFSQFQRFGPFARVQNSCCGFPLPGKTWCESSKEPHFDLKTAQAKTDEWNEMVKNNVHPAHQQKTLNPYLKYTEEQNKYIFGAAQPSSVFSNKSKKIIKDHVKFLAEREAKREKEFEEFQAGPSSGKGKQKVSAFFGTLYDPDKLIFEDTVDPGHYIKAFTFMNNYAKDDKVAFDNRKHKAKSVTLGQGKDQIRAFVISETSKQHLSTGELESSTHADLYMFKSKTKKSQQYGNVGAISNHTGRARKPGPGQAAKLERTVSTPR